MSHKEIAEKLEIQVKAQALRAKEAGSSRVCLGAAWRNVKDNEEFEQVLDMLIVIPHPQSDHHHSNKEYKRMRDFAQIKGKGVITKEIAHIGLDALNVDQYGLDEMDNRILTTIIDKFGGG
ncbi:unnamed protein product, partial [Cyprideis torosa]